MFSRAAPDRMSLSQRWDQMMVCMMSFPFPGASERRPYLPKDRPPVRPYLLAFDLPKADGRMTKAGPYTN